MVAVLLAMPETSHAVPQTFNTALPVAKGHFVFREQFLYRKASDDPSGADRNLELRGNVYYDRDNGEGPFCPSCWHSDNRRAVPVEGERGGHRRCPRGDWRGFESGADARRHAAELSGDDRGRDPITGY